MNLKELLSRSSNDVSRWDASQAERYAIAKHGPDGTKFLDPYLYELLSKSRLAKKKVIDIGCGAGPWTEHAINQGAQHVAGIDVNESMIDQALNRLKRYNALPRNTELQVANANELPYDHSTFDVAMSINVGCNLPDGDFQAHFKEAHRVTSDDGVMVVTAPHSRGA